MSNVEWISSQAEHEHFLTAYAREMQERRRRQEEQLAIFDALTVESERLTVLDKILWATLASLLAVAFGIGAALAGPAVEFVRYM